VFPWAASIGNPLPITYVLEYRVRNPVGAVTTITGLNSLSFEAQSLTSETEYEYRVRAQNSQGLSAFSAWAAVSTTAGEPAQLASMWRRFEVQRGYGNDNVAEYWTSLDADGVPMRDIGDNLDQTMWAGGGPSGGLWPTRSSTPDWGYFFNGDRNFMVSGGGIEGGHNDIPPGGGSTRIIQFRMHSSVAGALYNVLSSSTASRTYIERVGGEYRLYSGDAGSHKTVTSRVLQPDNWYTFAITSSNDGSVVQLYDLTDQQNVTLDNGAGAVNQGSQSAVIAGSGQLQLCANGAALQATTFHGWIRAVYLYKSALTLQQLQVEALRIPALGTY
jgi:hypothetical protein